MAKAKKKTKTTAKRKPASRKTTVRVKKTTKKTVKKVAKKKPAAKLGTLKLKKNDKALTRSQQESMLAEWTDLSKKDIKAVLDNLVSLISAHLNGPGEISLAGLLKIKVKRKPATKARKGINPFTGEETVFKAKPARNVVKITALKKLKDEV